MQRVDFYVTANQDLLVCKIIEKAYEQQLSTYVHTPDKKIAQQIDQLLWTFKEISFIPHQIWAMNAGLEGLILIGYETEAPKNRKLLVNLTPEIPAFYHNFERIVEFVLEDPEIKQKAREKYQFFRQAKWEVQSHQVTL